ncbi:MAG: prepilin-type N-terminal cleavage/methylation domain-containing protein [Planctomycetes bacterium]|nr:prepilin-type N-terminal cleavage/methylation domain-containing protein [Planctomycetota bacterium]
MRCKRAFTLIELMIVIAIISVIAAIAIPNLIAARKHGNHASAITALKTISTAETLFRENDKEEDNLFDYGTLTELANMNLIDDVLGSGQRAGYLFQAGPSALNSEFLWFAVANPVSPGSSGDLYFAINMRGAVYYTQEASISLNTTTCQLPANLAPMGK